MVDAQFSYTYEYQVCLHVRCVQPPGRGTASTHWKVISFLPDYLKPQQSEPDKVLEIDASVIRTDLYDRS